MRAALRRGAFACLFVLFAASASEADIRRVLVLQSFPRGNLALDYFTGNFRVDLEEASGDPVTFAQFVVNPAGFDDTPEPAILAYLNAVFAGRPQPDLLITIGGPAAAFVRKHRQALFPDVPLLFAAVDERFLHGVALGANETAVAVRNDMSTHVEGALQLFPQTSNIFVVVGTGELSRFWRQELEREFRRFASRVSFTWSDGMSFGDILNRVSSLPPHSAIFYMTFDTDAQGGAYSEDRVLADLYAAANAPLFASQDRQLGHGIVGGRLMSTEQLGRVAADVALRMLRGEAPGSIKTPIQTPGPPIFDWRELERWGVDERRLPAGSILRFREASAWHRYKWVIVGGASVLLAQALLITGLLVNRRRRQSAERSLRENVADLEAARRGLSSLSGRLMRAQEEERTRLARELHDDLGQRMAFLAMDVARLRDTLPDNTDAQGQARSLQEAVIAAGRDLQSLSHRLHASKIELLGLPAAAGNFCNELASRHDIRVHFAHDGVPARLPEGVALSLFRVLQEALSNVVKHARARECRVTLRGVDEGLRLEVSDDGRGFEAGNALSGHGLGLISMRERLNLVDGHLAIDSSAGGGTVLRATVPLRSAAPRIGHDTPSADRSRPSATV